jgi:superfamily I DNA/RNA helicase
MSNITPETIKFAAKDVKVYLAAAGAGNTTALMDEMTQLLATYRPDEIAFVTFTRKGVTNGIERALQSNPHLSVDDLIHFKTLHALCFRELGLKHTSILERADMEYFNRLLGFKVHLREAFEDQTEDDKLLTRYDALRSGSTKGAFVHGAYDEERYTRLTRAYEIFKQENNLVDFYDCLLKFRDAGKPVAVKVAFIDEAQDLTMLQWEVCQIAFSQCERVVISGDDFQSLFTYAGASPRTLVSLARRYNTIKLEKSYRISKSVYRFSRGITDLIEDKIEKDFVPAKDVEGFVKEITDRSVLARIIHTDLRKNGLSYYRWYLLFRNNCFIGEMCDLLEQYYVPYHTAKGFCLDIRYLRKIKRYFNFRKEGFSTKDAFDKFCKDNNIANINADFTESDVVPSERRFIYEAYIQEYGIDDLIEMAEKEPFLLLSTTHRVKGGEADNVAVFLDCTQKVSENALVNMDEELRVLYVACTRARTGLYLLGSKSPYGLDNIVQLIKENAA